MVTDKKRDKIPEYYNDGVKIQNFVFKVHSLNDEIDQIPADHIRANDNVGMQMLCIRSEFV